VTKHLRRAVAAVVLTLVAAGPVAGCGSEAGGGPAAPATVAARLGTTLTAATLTAGQEVPAPRGAAAFTVTGKITRTNGEDVLALDLSTLEQLGLTQLRLFEPWAKQDLEFRGVWLEDLLAVAGTAPGATTVHLVAHDDYVVDLTLAEANAGGLLIATRAADGSALPIDNGGPTRLVFADGVEGGANPDRWIWSLKTIDIR
jgi:hypothetical protein